MESAFGLTGKNFVLLVSDTNCPRSLVNQKNDIDKIIEIGNKNMVIFSLSLKVIKIFINIKLN